MAIEASPWWRSGVVYQVYPRSFQDSDGDGVGDLAGIAARLDYLAWLGVDAVWISPFYPSPMADFGYDIADHRDVDPLFGTLDDFDRLLERAHGLGLKVLLDYVPNHTSDRHPWFLESRSSRTSRRRDWYLWHDPAPGGGPPNNWLAVFGGSAWTLDAGTGQYYCHSFLPEQPDLDWRNPDVREAMLDVLRFWLDRGVDGFRVDALAHVIKDAELRDNPPNPDWVPSRGPYYRHRPVYSTDRPELLGIIAEMRRLVDSYGERMLIGEAYLPVERLVAYYGEPATGIHLPFNFQLIKLPWEVAALKPAIDAYEAALPAHGWPNWVLGNHDKPRIASRVGPSQARVAAMLLLTLRGTPTLYYGDEIGMTDVPIAPERVRDPYERNVPGLGLGRDPARTPMQWDASPFAGFSTAEPWLPLADDFRIVNVAAQRADARSMLELHRRLLELRDAQPALSLGDYLPLPGLGDVLAYVRRSAGGRAFVVALNLGGEEQSYPLARAGRVALSTHLDRDESLSRRVELRPNEGVIVLVSD